MLPLLQFPPWNEYMYFFFIVTWLINTKAYISDNIKPTDLRLDTLTFKWIVFSWGIWKLKESFSNVNKYENCWFCVVKICCEWHVFSITAELGDYDPAVHTPGYISEFRFVPDPFQTEDMELAIFEKYKTGG